MARILSLLILLVIVSVLAADPVQPCYDKAEYSSNFVRDFNKSVNHII